MPSPQFSAFEGDILPPTPSIERQRHEYFFQEIFMPLQEAAFMRGSAAAAAA